jgi:hypothetical protein
MREDLLPNRTVYHGTDVCFKSFDVSTSLGAHFGTVKAASDRLKSTGRLEIEYQVYSSHGQWFVRELNWSNKPAFEHGPFDDCPSAECFIETAPKQRRPLAFEIDVYRPLELDDLGTWDFEIVFNELSRKHRESFGALLEPVWDAWRKSSHLGWESLKRAIEAAGFDSIAYVNQTEDPGSISWIVLRAEKIFPKWTPGMGEGSADTADADEDRDFFDEAENDHWGRQRMRA